MTPSATRPAPSPTPSTPSGTSTASSSSRTCTRTCCASQCWRRTSSHQTVGEPDSSVGLIVLICGHFNIVYLPFLRLPGSHRSPSGHNKERDGGQRCSQSPPPVARSGHRRNLGETRPAAVRQIITTKTHSNAQDTLEPLNFIVK